MRIELDAEYDILYIELREGDVERTEDLDDGAHIDLDTEGRVLGLEFLSIEAFRNFLEHHGGRVEIPDVVEGEGTLHLQQPSEEDLAKLGEAITHLGLPQQTILRLRFYEGLTLAEIAQELGTTKPAASAQLKAVLKELRREFAADETSALQRLEEYHAVAR